MRDRGGGGRMKIKSEDFLNADEEKKEKIINMIVEFETHNSFSKACLIEAVKYQQKRIETLGDYISDEFKRVKTLYLTDHILRED